MWLRGARMARQLLTPDFISFSLGRLSWSTSPSLARGCSRERERERRRQTETEGSAERERERESVREKAVERERIKVAQCAVIRSVHHVGGGCDCD